MTREVSETTTASARPHATGPTSDHDSRIPEVGRRGPPTHSQKIGSHPRCRHVNGQSVAVKFSLILTFFCWFSSLFEAIMPPSHASCLGSLYIVCSIIDGNIYAFVPVWNESKWTSSSSLGERQGALMAPARNRGRSAGVLDHSLRNVKVLLSSLSMFFSALEAFLIVPK